MKIRCEYCRQKNDANQNHCGYCGAPLPDAEGGRLALVYGNMAITTSGGYAGNVLPIEESTRERLLREWAKGGI